MEKRQALMKQLQDRLARRLPSYVFTPGLDSSGNPTLIVTEDSAWATGEFACALRIKQMANDFKDVVGQPQPSYTPHVLECHVEGDDVAAPVRSFNPFAGQAALECEMWRLGLRIRQVVGLAAVQPSIALLDAPDAGSLEAVISPDLEWPLSGQ
jgi:hypothetical protein